MKIGVVCLIFVLFLMSGVVLGAEPDVGVGIESFINRC